MAHSFFKSKKRLLVLSSIVTGSMMTMLSFQNCAGGKTGSTDQVGVSAAANSSTDPVSKNMDNGNSGSLPTGTIGGAGGIDQFRGADVLLPGFTISKKEIVANQAVNADSINKDVVCKLFARPIVQVGQTASYMVVMYDVAGKENFDTYKDASGNLFKFPIAGAAHIDLVGANSVIGQSAVGVRETLPQESHRLGHAVFVVNNPTLAGNYSRVAEVFNERGQLVCRTNQVLTQVITTNALRPTQTGCVSKDVLVSESVPSSKLCAGFRILGTDLDQNGLGNKIAVSDFFGSKEANAQANSRLQAAQFCNSGRALVSKLKDISDGSLLVENECLK